MAIVIYMSSIYGIKLPCCNRQHLLSVHFSMSHCDKSVSHGCNAVEIRLARVLLSLKPTQSVPQDCSAVKIRLEKVFIPLKPIPAQTSLQIQKVVDFFF